MLEASKDFVRKFFDSVAASSISRKDEYDRIEEEAKARARITILEAELETALAEERKEIKKLIKKLKASH